MEELSTVQECSSSALLLVYQKKLLYTHDCPKVKHPIRSKGELDLVFSGRRNARRVCRNCASFISVLCASFTYQREYQVYIYFRGPHPSLCEEELEVVFFCLPRNRELGSLQQLWHEPPRFNNKCTAFVKNGIHVFFFGRLGLGLLGYTVPSTRAGRAAAC